MIKGIAAAASQAPAAVAAEAALAAGYGAVDAIIAGFFAAAGADPGALLAPAVALVAGFGAGARAFDGRAAQPGRGGARPRGFIDEASIREGAWVAAPRSLAMLMLAHSYQGRAPLRELVREGARVAEAAGAPLRARLLDRIGSAGVLALRSPDVSRPLLGAGGPTAGGILTLTDVEEPLPADADAAVTALEPSVRVFSSPFQPQSDGPPPADRAIEVIAACDGRGGLAALAYARAVEGVFVPELELLLGRDAIPVRRGVTREPPGAPRPMPVPIAILTRAPGFSAVVGLPGQAALDAHLLEHLPSGMAADTALAELCKSAGGRAALAVVTDGRAARAVRA